MPAVAKSNFVQSMVVEECLGDIVTRGEEAFGFLILENNIQRWCHIAGEKDGPMPELKYQKTVKRERMNVTLLVTGLTWGGKGLTR